MPGDPKQPLTVSGGIKMSPRAARVETHRCGWCATLSASPHQGCAFLGPMGEERPLDTASARGIG